MTPLWEYRPLRIRQKSASCLLFHRQSRWQHPPDLNHQFYKSVLKVTRFVKIQTFR